MKFNFVKFGTSHKSKVQYNKYSSSSFVAIAKGPGRPRKLVPLIPVNDALTQWWTIFISLWTCTVPSSGYVYHKSQSTLNWEKWCLFLEKMWICPRAMKSWLGKGYLNCGIVNDCVYLHSGLVRGLEWRTELGSLFVQFVFSTNSMAQMTN